MNNTYVDEQQIPALKDKNKEDVKEDWGVICKPVYLKIIPATIIPTFFIGKNKWFNIYTSKWRKAPSKNGIKIIKNLMKDAEFHKGLAQLFTQK